MCAGELPSDKTLETAYATGHQCGHVWNCCRLATSRLSYVVQVESSTISRFFHFSTWVKLPGFVPLGWKPSQEESCLSRNMNVCIFQPLQTDLKAAAAQRTACVNNFILQKMFLGNMALEAPGQALWLKLRAREQSANWTNKHMINAFGAKQHWPIASTVQSLPAQLVPLVLHATRPGPKLHWFLRGV